MQALSLQPDFSPSFIKVKKSKCLPLLAVKPIFNEKARLDFLCLRRCTGCGNWIHVTEGGRIVPQAVYCTTETKRGLLSERVFIFIMNGSECRQVSEFSFI